MLSRILVLILFVLLCLTFSIAPLHEESLPNLVERVEPAVVFIKTFDSYGNQLNMGTGFFINPWELITCSHVLKGAYRATIETASGQEFEIGNVTGINADLDLVKAEIDNPVIPMPYVEISSDKPRKGERIFVLGNPRGYRFVVSEGIIAAFHFFSRERIQVTAPISPGSSGSPVINMSGEVVGIITCYNDTGQHLNFAVPAPLIYTLTTVFISIEQL